jgi:hypothetical protein
MYYLPSPKTVFVSLAKGGVVVGRFAVKLLFGVDKVKTLAKLLTPEL